MSKFWAAGSSDESSSDSSSDDSSSSSDSSADGAPVGRGGGAGDNKWVMESDSESEDDVRVVKSAKTRAFEAFDAHVSTIRNAMKIQDNQKLMAEFDILSKVMTKSKKVFANHGGVPRSLVRILVDVEDFVAKSLADKATFKKLKPASGRALNRMKLALKKFSVPYRGIMEEYRKNPVVSDDESSDDDDKSDSDSDSDSDSSSSSSSSNSSSASSVKKVEKVVAAKKVKAVSSDSDSDSDGDSDSSDEDEWASDSSSDSSEDEDEAGVGELKGRARWLKQTVVVKEKVVKDKEGRGKDRKAAKEEAVLAKAVAEAISPTSTKTFIPEENLTPSVIKKKTLEVVSSRGRKGADSSLILRQLEALSRLAVRFGPRVEIPVLMHVITAQFDLQRTIDDYMKTPAWNSCAGYLGRIGAILDDDEAGWMVGSLADDDGTTANDLMINAAIGKKGGKMKKAAAGGGKEGAMSAVAAEEKLINPHTNEVETQDEREERLRLEAEAKMSPEELKTVRVPGSLSLFLSRLDEEYNKSLQRISPHSIDYVLRLRDESKLVELLTVFQRYYERCETTSEAATLAELRVEHLYYRHDTIAVQVDRAAKFHKTFGETHMLHPACVSSSDAAGTDYSKTHPGATSGAPSMDSIGLEQLDMSKQITDLCTYVYRFGSDRQKTRAMLCHIYHHALHDRFLEARDLLLMSHLQETIPVAGDITTMILFNRMMVTLGLAAFRLGKIWDAHQCLSDICSGRVRELLAQGVSTGRFSDKTPDQEKAEKRRQVPYHQHINLDLLDACHLISAMFLEVPNMAGGDVVDQNNRRRVLSRTFRKFHDIYDRQVFTGPPEQTRDYVMTATKALMKGDWKKCTDLLNSLEVWNLVSGENADEAIKTMLVEKVKQTGLRTYLLAFSAQYDSLSLAQLRDMFDMGKNEVHSVVSKMMINRDIIASWDQPTETIVMRKVEPSALQGLALQFAEKAAGLVDANERDRKSVV